MHAGLRLSRDSACVVQHAVAARGGAFDLEAACSGFVYALAIADSMIRTGAARSVLVIGSEVYSRVLNWTDRSTCILFGDGAAAVVLARSALPGALPRFELGSDGSAASMLTMYSAALPRARRTRPRRRIHEWAGYVQVRRAHACRRDRTHHACRGRLALDDIEWFVPTRPISG